VRLGTTSRARWRRRRRRIGGTGIAAPVVGALLAVAAAGCTSVRSDLGTSDSSCYLALPTATKAVHGHGHLAGVHRYTLATLRKNAAGLYSQLDTADRPSQVVCVVAFKGRFTADSVSDAHGRSSGSLAAVVTTEPGNHLLGTVIFTRPPIRFGHSHIG
jgi:hypothetical protein